MRYYLVKKGLCTEIDNSFDITPRLAGKPISGFNHPNHLPDRSEILRRGYPVKLNVVNELIAINAKKYPENVAINENGCEIVYGKLWNEVVRVAAYLKSYEWLEEGDRIAIILPNSSNFVVVWAAVILAGFVAVPIAPALGSKEVREIVMDSGAGLLVCMHSGQYAFNDGDKTAVVLEEYINNVRDNQDANFDWFSSCDTAHNDVAMLAYTSGSTGVQKGTLHTHSELLSIADYYCYEIINPGFGDVFYCHAPLAFTYSLGAALIFPFRFGATTFLNGKSFHPGEFCQNLKLFSLDRLFLTPTALQAILYVNTESDKRELFSKVKSLVSAGEKLSSSLRREWENETALKVLDGIGSTEMLHIYLSNRHDESYNDGALGHLVSGYDAILLDDDNEVITNVSAQGILAVKGPTGVKYWKNLDKQNLTLVDGYTVTNDVFKRDENGRYYFLGRSDDVILCNGYKISPIEIEEVALELDYIQQALCIEIRPSGGVSQICMVVRVNDRYEIDKNKMSRQLRKHISGKLAGFKVPQKIDFVSEYPVTATGKVSRSLLKEQYASLYKS